MRGPGHVWAFGLERREPARAFGVVAYADEDRRPSVFAVEVTNAPPPDREIVGEPRQVAACLDEVSQRAALRLLGLPS